MYIMNVNKNVEFVIPPPTKKEREEKTVFIGILTKMLECIKLYIYIYIDTS